MRRALILLVCLIGALVAAAFLLGAVHVYHLTAASMEPTLHCARPGLLCRANSADRLVTLRYVLIAPAKGDIVAFRAPVKARSACRLPSGAVLIKRITKIVHGRYFLEGDNRQVSCDSRVWGTVPRSSLIGRVVGTYWPLSRISFR